MSTDAIAAAGLIASALVVLVLGGGLASSTASIVRSTCVDLGTLGKAELDTNEWAGLLTTLARAGGLPTLTVVLPLVAVIVLAAYAQAGLRITPKAIAWNPGRLNPMQGWKRVFSSRGVVRTITAFVKISLVTLATAWMAWRDVPHLSGLVGADIGPALKALGTVFAHCSLAALVTVVAIAAFDLFYQRWQHERDLRMSKKDIQEEFKTTEGDPHVKAKIRGIQREMSRRRMMSEVPKATVVVTNPTHFAVALRYDRDQDEARGRAPVVVAKGTDAVAQRIKEIAREAGVPLHEDVPLARALHAQVEIGTEIPERLFQAVAGVLAYVYRIQRGAAAPARTDA